MRLSINDRTDAAPIPMMFDTPVATATIETIPAPAVITVSSVSIASRGKSETERPADGITIITGGIGIARGIRINFRIWLGGRLWGVEVRRSRGGRRRIGGAVWCGKLHPQFIPAMQQRHHHLRRAAVFLQRDQLAGIRVVNDGRALNVSDDDLPLDLRVQQFHDFADAGGIRSRRTLALSAREDQRRNGRGRGASRNRRGADRERWSAKREGSNAENNSSLKTGAKYFTAVKHTCKRAVCASRSKIIYVGIIALVKDKLGVKVPIPRPSSPRHRETPSAIIRVNWR